MIRTIAAALAAFVLVSFGVRAEEPAKTDTTKAEAPKAKKAKKSKKSKKAEKPAAAEKKAEEKK